MAESPSTSSSIQVILYNILKVIFMPSVIVSNQNEHKVTPFNAIIV